MGVSFKIARMGTRYRSRLSQIQDEDDDNESVDSQPSVNQGNFSGVADKISDLSNVLAKTGLHSASDDIEASFSLNLFPDGFSIGKVSESFSNAPEQLYPYNRASEMLFSAIEYGWLPGDTFDDLPIKYVNGSVLCTIQDYRNCLSPEGGIGSIQKSPTVNRVILHMSMENVVKDILSISDDCWTYKDILEVESSILKALQPNLCLSPQPLLGKHCREPSAKKVNLDISWSWKKRDQLNAPATNQVFSNSCHVNVTPGQNSNFLGGLVHQDRQVVCAKENIPTQILNQESNTLQEMKSHFYPLTSLPTCHLGETRDLSTLAELTTSNVSVSKRSSIKRTSDQTKLNSSNLNVKVRCQKQAIQGPPLKKPNKEPVDYSYQQFPRKSIETSAPTQLWWQNTMLQQQIEAEKPLSERFQDKGCSSQLIKNGLPSNLEGIMYSQHSADRFASQFSLLMAREGYSLASDRVEPMYPETEGSSSSQQRSTINQSAGAFGPSSSTSTPVLLPCMLSPMTGNTSALNSSQLLSKQIPSGAQLLPAEYVVSSPQFTSSCSPKLEPDIAAQFSSLTLEMQEIMNRRSELQLQLKQRLRHQELLMQRRAMLGAPTATTGLSGSPRLGGRNGIQGVSNFSIGSSGNVTGPMASKPNILGGHTPLSGNIGQKNNLSSNTFGLNDSNQLLASSLGYLAAVSYMLGPADGQWRGLEGGVPIQRNDLLVPINNPKVPGVPLIQRNDLLVPITSPKVPEIPCTLGRQHQVQMQMYQHEVQRPQPCVLQQQDIRLLIDNLQSVNFATQQVGSSPTHLSPQQFSQQPQINQHYKNPGSVLEEMNTRNTMESQGKVERGWKMHGAANGSKKI